MSSSLVNNTMSSEQTGTVSARAGEWIARVLREIGMPMVGTSMLTIEEESQLDLRSLNGEKFRHCGSSFLPLTYFLHSFSISNCNGSFYDAIIQ
mmetsp:Transcript_6230/g.11943  ORF Transcript_6230/g.11943 Transcript_6230/m.11943 type:complete len:94 (-) Transcript_6230:1868-2149(-)